MAFWSLFMLELVDIKATFEAKRLSNEFRRDLRKEMAAALA
jgi:hypothetical protein